MLLRIGALFFLSLLCTQSMEARNKASDSRCSNFSVKSIELWTKHVVFTREAIFAVRLGNKAEVDAVVTTLLDNQDQIADRLFCPFVGRASAAQVAAVLKDHIVKAADYIIAVSAGGPSSDAAQKAFKVWLDQVNDIANVFSSITNNVIDRSITAKFFAEHVIMTGQEIDTFFAGNFTQSINLFNNQIYPQIIEMARYFERQLFIFKRK